MGAGDLVKGTTVHGYKDQGKVNCCDFVTQAAVKAMVRTHKTLFKATAQGMEAVEASACL